MGISAEERAREVLLLFQALLQRGVTSVIECGSLRVCRAASYSIESLCTSFALGSQQSKVHQFQYSHRARVNIKNKPNSFRSSCLPNVDFLFTPMKLMLVSQCFKNRCRAGKYTGGKHE